MRWRGRAGSGNVVDRRGRGIGLIGGGAGAVLIAIVAMFFGVDPGAILQSDGEAPPQDPANDTLAHFVSVVLKDTEVTWSAIFRESGAEYQEPTLVLFSGAVESACGFAQAAVGPFYCPLDRHVYIDLSFFRELRDRFGAPGDFAQAYVLAHEVGHHVQTLLGVTQDVQARARGAPREVANALSVRQELQADCFAGIWGYHARNTLQVLDPGDLEEALAAASAIGDDRLQMQAQGYVAPESFTHGSAEQRREWFRRGFDSGDPRACDTFEG